jgi:hypothetical protein
VTSQITPYIVRVIEAPTRETTVVDILVGSFGLIGIIVLAAVVFGLGLGGLLVWFRNSRPGNVINGQSAGESALHLNTLSQS